MVYMPEAVLPDSCSVNVPSPRSSNRAEGTATQLNVASMRRGLTAVECDEAETAFSFDAADRQLLDTNKTPKARVVIAVFNIRFINSN